MSIVDVDAEARVCRRTKNNRRARLDMLAEGASVVSARNAALYTRQASPLGWQGKWVHRTALWPWPGNIAQWDEPINFAAWSLMCVWPIPAGGHCVEIRQPPSDALKLCFSVSYLAVLMMVASCLPLWSSQLQLETEAEALSVHLPCPHSSSPQEGPDDVHNWPGNGLAARPSDHTFLHVPCGNGGGNGNGGGGAS